MAVSRGSITVSAVLVLLFGGVVRALPSDAAAPGPPDHPTAVAGNPFVDGWYSQPRTAFDRGQHWVSATSAQDGVDAFSSPDLIHWTRHPGAAVTPTPSPIERAGRYYLIGSDSYAIADSPAGPFTTAGPLLRPDPAVATEPGHGSGVINVPGTDIWYLVYDRRPPGSGHRVLAYDRLTFNADGTIQPVTMRVADNFADGNALGWTIKGGSWRVGGRRLTVSGASDARAMLDTNFADLVYDADVTITGGEGSAGLIFRGGYYARLETGGEVVLSKSDTPLASAPLAVVHGRAYHVRVTANGPTIAVYVDDLTVPKLSVIDSGYATGPTGVRASGTAAGFGKISVAHP
jgi:hypothetical protein